MTLLESWFILKYKEEKFVKCLLFQNVNVLIYFSTRVYTRSDYIKGFMVGRMKPSDVMSSSSEPVKYYFK